MIDFDLTTNSPGGVYTGILYIDAATYAIIGMKMRQDKRGYSPGVLEYNGVRKPFLWNSAEFEAGFTKIDGKYRPSYLLTRDSFFIDDGKLASVNYSFVYSASKSATATGSFPVVLDSDLYYQLKDAALSANTGFNTLLPTAEEQDFFNRK